MAHYYVAYTKSLCYKYKANVRSNVTVFLVLNAFFSFILPLILSYSSKGFWIKQFSFREHPTVNFKYQYLIIIDHRNYENFADSLICTTSQSLVDSMRLFFDHCSLLKIIEVDEDRDGRADRLLMEIEITNVTRLDITAVHVFLVFDYKIYEECVFSTEIMAVLSHEFPEPIGKVDLVSGMITNTKQALDCTARHDVKRNPSVFSELATNSTLPYLKRLLSSYASRTFTVDLANTYLVTEPKTKVAVNEPFVITIEIRYDEQVIIYKTRFWQFMKWAWIQYLSLSALFLLLSKKIKRFVFQNRILQTIKVHPKEDE